MAGTLCASESQTANTQVFQDNPGIRRIIISPGMTTPEKTENVSPIVVATGENPELSDDHSYNGQVQGTVVINVTSPVSVIGKTKHKDKNTTSPNASKVSYITVNKVMADKLTPSKEKQTVIVQTSSHEDISLDRAKLQYVSPTFQQSGHKKAQPRVSQSPNTGRRASSGNSKPEDGDPVMNNNNVYPNPVKHHDDVIALIKTKNADNKGPLMYYQCNFCNYGITSATDRDDIIRHVEVSHTIKCPWCDFTARTRSRIYHHHLEAHQDNKHFLINRGLALAVKAGTEIYEEISLFSSTKKEFGGKSTLYKSEEERSDDDLVTLIANGVDIAEEENEAIVLPTQSDIEEAEKLVEALETEAGCETSSVMPQQEIEPEVVIKSNESTEKEEEFLPCHYCNVMLGSEMFHRLHLLVAHKLVVDDNGTQLFLVTDHSIHKAILATQEPTRQSYSVLPDLDIRLGLERRLEVDPTDELIQVARSNNIQQLVDIREVLIQWFKSIEGQQSQPTPKSEPDQVQQDSTSLHTLQNAQIHQEEVSQTSLSSASPAPMESLMKWECFYCPFTASENSDVVNHIVKTHPGAMIRIKQLFSDDKDVSDSQAEKTEEKPVYCYYCNHIEYKMELLTTHIQTVHPGEKILATMSVQSINTTTAPPVAIGAGQQEVLEVGSVDEEIEDDGEEYEIPEEMNKSGIVGTENSESDTEVPTGSVYIAEAQLKKEKEELLKSTLLEMETALYEETERPAKRKRTARPSTHSSDFVWPGVNEADDEQENDDGDWMDEPEAGGMGEGGSEPPRKTARRGRKPRKIRDPTIQPSNLVGKGGFTKRKVACKKCANCLRQECGQCIYCRDMPKFGGKGTLKQCCLYRKCLNRQRYRIGSRSVVPRRKSLTDVNIIPRDGTMQPVVGTYLLDSNHQEEFVFDQEKSPFETGKNFYRCPHCTRTCAGKQELDSHVTYCHPGMKLDKTEVRKFRKPASSSCEGNPKRAAKNVNQDTKQAVIKLVPLEKFGRFDSYKSAFLSGEIDRLCSELKQYDVKSLCKETTPVVKVPSDPTTIKRRGRKPGKVTHGFKKANIRNMHKTAAIAKEVKLKAKLDMAEESGLMKRVSVTMAPQALGMTETKYQCTRCPFITRSTNFMWNHLNCAHNTDNKSPKSECKRRDMEKDTGSVSVKKSPKQLSQAVMVGGSPKQTSPRKNVERTLDFQDF